MKRFFLLFFLIANLFAADATVEIIKRMEKLPTIGLLDSTSHSVDNDFKSRFFKMLVGDLKVSTHFNVIDSYYKDEGGSPNSYFFGQNPDLILRYSLEESFSSEIIARVKLIQANSGETRFEKSYKVSQKERYPFLAHRIIVELNDSLGHPSISWMERFIIFSKYTSPKESEIVIGDYTLTFTKTIIKGGLNIFPKWADNEQEGFYYSDYNQRFPTIYYVNLSSGKKEKIIHNEGMMIVSDVSKDSKKLLLTMAPKDQPDVFLYDVSTRKVEQVTRYGGIDVGATFVDDDSGIVFVSDRLGYPNIFTQKIGTQAVTQMVYHGKNNNSVTSYDRYMVYSSREKASEFGAGTFNLYLISTKTDFIRQLTATGKNLFPRFSNDGESILFIKEFGSQSALGIIRLGANKSYHFPLKAGHIQSIDW